MNHIKRAVDEWERASVAVTDAEISVVELISTEIHNRDLNVRRAV